MERYANKCVLLKHSKLKLHIQLYNADCYCLKHSKENKEFFKKTAVWDHCMTPKNKGFCLRWIKLSLVPWMLDGAPSKEMWLVNFSTFSVSPWLALPCKRLWDWTTTITTFISLWLISSQNWLHTKKSNHFKAIIALVLLILLTFYFCWCWEVLLDGEKISFKNLKTAAAASGSPDPNAREVCICASGALFLAPANSRCQVSSIC